MFLQGQLGVGGQIAVEGPEIIHDPVQAAKD